MKKTYNLDVYETRLIITNDRETYINIRQKLNLEISVRDCPSCFMFKGVSYIYLPRKSDRAAACHEAVHVAIDILDDIGFKLDPDNQEPLAWLVDWVFRKCMDFKSKELK